MGYYNDLINNIKHYRIGNKKVILIWISALIIFSSFNIILMSAQNAAGTNMSKTQINYIDYDVVIDNNYAITEISELVKNPNDDSVDQNFTFQIPETAFISNFSMQLDGKMYYAQVVPCYEGQKRFEEAVISGSDAGLVEAKGKNVFSYSVSLSPYSEILVGLRYEQFIVKKLGGYEYIIPLSGNKLGNTLGRFSIDVLVKSPLFLTNMDSENHIDSTTIDFLGKNIGEAHYQSTSAPQVDFILKYKLKAPPINGTMMNYHYNEEEYFMHVFSPQRDDLGGAAMDKEIIFVLDKSGSMQGKKISQLKEAFEEIIKQLPGNDKLNLIMFDHSIKKYETELFEANSENKNDAVSYINSITAGGSTNINDAIVSALEMFEYSETKVPIIVMLTDGLPTAGVTNPNAIRDNIMTENSADVAIFSLGFGYDVDFEFLKAMSLENYGMALRIYEGEDASEQITNFYNTISTPLLKNLQFSYSDGAYEVYPTKLDQLFEGAEAVVVGKYQGENRSISSTVEATSWEGQKEFKETFELEADTNNSFMPRLWAYQKIKYMLNELTVQGANEILEENITQLALEFEFVTPFTSLLVEVNPKTDNLDSSEDDNDGYVGKDENKPNDSDSSSLISPEESDKTEKDDNGLGVLDGDDECGELACDNTMVILPCMFIFIFIIIIVILVAIGVSKKKK